MKFQTPDKSLFDDVALEMAIDGAFVEKDWYVTQLLGVIAAFSYQGVEMVFWGGTALSKAHKLINRFSEDIDFRIIYPELEKLNKSKQRHHLSLLKNAVFDHINSFIPLLPENLTARNDNRFFAIDLKYPAVYPPDMGLRPHVQIEFTVSKMSIPPVQCSVSSFVNELSKKDPEVSSIACIDPVENATDKLSAFVWRIADRIRSGENDDPSIVRHQHDLAILKTKAIAHSDFKKG